MDDDRQDGIRWPEEFLPARCPVHVRNELAMAAPSDAVWAWLVRAREWPAWYLNSAEVRIDHGNAELTPGAAFRWRTFGISLVSQVQEFVPGERIAWNARSTGVWVYHAWLIRPTTTGCHVITEESQHGWIARLGHLFMPQRMGRQHQTWLEELERKAQSGFPTEPPQPAAT